MPGVKSLEAQEYYAHPQNAFWKLLAEILRKPFPETYERKKELILQNQIALWDVLKSCERQGSSDAAIKNEIPNNLDDVLQNNPTIKKIYCNGGKAYTSLIRHFPHCKAIAARLPSTSPLHTVSYSEKLKSWTAIREFLD